MSNIFAFLRRLPFAAKNKILTVGLQSLVLIAAGGGAFAANAFPSSVTQNGLAWLSSQVQASGGMAAGGATGATEWQVQAETVGALRTFNQTLPPTLRDSIQSRPDDGVTELLSRQVLVRSAAGVDSVGQQSKLISLQYAGSGWGASASHQPNALDTAYALLALNAVANTSGVESGLAFLRGQQYSSGGFGLPSSSAETEQPSVFGTSLAVLAMASWRQQFDAGTSLANAQRWLLASRSAGVYGSTLENAVALMALSRQTSDEAVLQPLVDALVRSQQANGSWDGDGYLTALALRALGTYSLAPSTPTTGSLSGVVVDKDTGSPLSNVSIALVGSSSQTVASAADGKFSIYNIAPGAYKLSLSQAGYATVQVSVDVAAGQLLNLGVVRLSAAPNTATLKGTVKNIYGTPLANALIAVGANSALTDGAGAYSITGIEAGTRDVVASLSGYSTVTVSIAFGSGQNYVFSPTLQNPGGSTTLSGTVLDADSGTPLVGATVKIGSAAATTAAGGTFTLSNLSPGSFTLNVSATGYPPAAFSGVLMSGANSLGTIRLSKQVSAPSTATLSGVVKNTAGTPLKGVSIAVAGLSVLTDANGAYELAAIPAAYANVKASLTGYSDISVLVNFEAGKNYLFSPVMGSNPTYASLQGKVVDALTGAPIAGATLTLGGLTRNSAADGAFTFQSLNPGNFTLTVDATGYQSVTASGTMTLGANDVGSIRLTKVAATRKLSGIVTDALTQAPIAGAKLSLSGVAGSATTGSDGRYSFDAVAGTSASLTATAQGYVTQTFALTFGQLGDASFDLQLARPIASRIAINHVQTDKPLYDPFGLIKLEVELQNGDAQAASLLVEADVVDPQNRVVYTFMANAPTGWAGSRQPNQPIMVPGNGALTVPMEWHVLRQPAGSYVVRARAVDGQGKVVAEGQAQFEVSSAAMMSGGLITNPPLLQYGTNQSVALTASVTNVGNQSIPAGNVDLKVILEAPDATGSNQAVTRATTIATAGPMNEPRGLERDAAGNLYTANYYDGKVLKYDASGVASVLATLPSGAYPNGLTLASNGDLWIVGASLYKVTAAGVVSTFNVGALGNLRSIGIESTGALILGGTDKKTGQPQVIRRDTAGTEEVLYTGGLANPIGFVKDDAGNYVVTNYGDHTLTKVSAADGVITPFVAVGSGPAALNRPWGITRDAQGNFYIANSGANNVIKVTSAGATSVYASGFSSPRDVKFDNSGTLFVSSAGDHTIYAVAPNGAVSVYARGGVANSPQGMRYDASGNLWIANNDGTLRVLNSTGETNVVATGLSSPRGLALDGNGNTYVAGYSDGTIQKINSLGQRSTFVSGLSNPWGVAVDGNGAVWVSEYGASRIKAFDATGTPLQSLESLLVNPDQVRIGTQGETYVRNASTILVVDGQGPRVLYKDAAVVMDAIAVDPSTGNLVGKRGFDLYRIDKTSGVASKFATLPSGKSWYGIAADAAGNAYSIDYYAHVIYKITSAGVVTAFSDALPYYVSVIGNDLAGNLTAYYSSSIYFRFAADGKHTQMQVANFGGEYIYRLAASSDGGLVAVGYNKSFLLDPDTQTLRRTINVPTLYNYTDLALNNDGAILAVHSGENLLYKGDSGATALSPVLSGMYYPQDMAWVGGELLFVGSSNRMYKYSPGAAAPTRVVNSPSHSGYFATVGGVTYLASGGAVYKFENGTASNFASLSGSQDGGLAAKADALAVASYSQSRVSVLNTSGSTTAQYAGILSPHGLAFDQSGQMLVASQGNSSIVRVAAAKQSAWVGAVPSPQSLAFDAQGQLWATSTSGSVVKLSPQGNVIETRNTGFSTYGVGFDGQRMVLPNYQSHQMGEWITDRWQPFASGLSSAPVALEVDASNTIWMASGNNGSLLTLKNNALQTQATGLTNLSAMRLSSAGVYLGGNGWAKLRTNTGAMTDLRMDGFTNGNPIQGLANGSLYALVAGSQKQILRLDTTLPTAVAPAGTVAYQVTMPMPALPSADGYVTLDLGQWLPPYGGDFKVLVTRSGVQGSLDNYLHVGPHATSDLQALKAELPPGDPELPMCMNLDGADFTSISRVEIANVKPLVNTGFPQGLTSDRSGNIFYTAGDTLYKAAPGQTAGVPFASGFAPSFGLATDSSETMYLSSRNASTGNYELVAVAKDGSKRTVVDLGVRQTNGLVVNSKDEVIIGTAGQLLKVNAQGQLSSLPTAGLPNPRGIAIDGKDNIYAQNDNSGQLVSMMNPAGSATAIFNGANGGDNSPYFEGDGYPNIAADCAENFYIAPYNWTKISQLNTEEHVLAQVIPRTGRVAVLFDALKISPYFNDIDYLAYDKLNNRLLVWNHGDGNVWGVPVTCGAISVDVHLFTKPGQRITGTSKAPVATIPQADGRTEYVWSLKDVTSSGAQVCFDASQKGLRLGEKRAAIDSGYMSFQNSFAPAPVTVPVAIPDVRGANLVGITVAADKAEYPAQDSAQITTALTNANVRDVTGVLTVDVLDAAGQSVGRVVQQGVTIPTKDSLSVPAPFAIGSIVPAKYTVRATLVEGDVVVAQALSDFIVLADQQSASAVSQVGTDRKTYRPSDRVQLSSMANSRSANLILNDLTLMVRVYGPAGDLKYSHGHPVPQLLPGALMNFAAAQPLVSAAPGVYTVAQDLLDSQNRLLHSTQTTYSVGSSADSGFGLGGTIAVQPQVVRIGEPVSITAQATNQGNSALSNLPLAVWIVDPSTQAVLHKHDVTANLNVGASTSVNDSWLAAGTDGQSLMAVLVATVNGSGGSPTQLTLAQAYFALSLQTLVATGGTPQSTRVHSAFPQQLQATVLRGNGIPVAGAIVTFTAVGGQGATVTFPAGNTATTDAQGHARISLLAGGGTGNVTVIASSPVASGSAVFNLAVSTSAGAEPIPVPMWGGEGGEIALVILSALLMMLAFAHRRSQLAQASRNARH